MSGRPGLIALLAVLAPIQTGCATTSTAAIEASAPAAIRRVCFAWPYVSWSRADTPRTIADARASNAAHDGFCGGGNTSGG